MIKLHQVRTPNRIAIQYSLAFINVSKHNGFFFDTTTTTILSQSALATILAFGEYTLYHTISHIVLSDVYRTPSIVYGIINVVYRISCAFRLSYGLSNGTEERKLSPSLQLS
uniref:Uncharacterized protein n=1 Tax=Glossina palpalis gambiensis TaxID=67801 RepID=A0A1B0BZ48_9MUSC